MVPDWLPSIRFRSKVDVLFEDYWLFRISYVGLIVDGAWILLLKASSNEDSDVGGNYSLDFMISKRSPWCPSTPYQSLGAYVDSKCTYAEWIWNRVVNRRVDRRVGKVFELALYRSYLNLPTAKYSRIVSAASCSLCAPMFYYSNIVHISDNCNIYHLLWDCCIL